MKQQIELMEKLRDSIMATNEANMQELDAAKVELMNEIRNVALNVAKHPKDSYRISGSNYSWEVVAQQLTRLTPDHIEYVAYQLSHLNDAIQYRPAYILSCLFNAASFSAEQAQAALAARIEQEEIKENEFDLDAFCHEFCSDF